MTQPPDHDIRLEIAESLERSYVVMAGAGTGKTQLVVDRITTGLIEERIEPENLVAITFTEAAAFELKERLRENLLKAAEASATSNAAKRRRLESVLARLDSAKISTIHSFAQSILTEFPLQAGVPVAFRVQDPAIYLAGALERWKEYLTQVLTTESGRVLHAILLGLGYDPFYKSSSLVRQLLRSWALLLLPKQLGSSRGDGDPREWQADALWKFSEGRLAPVLDEIKRILNTAIDAVAALEHDDIQLLLPTTAQPAALACIRISERLRHGLAEEPSEDLLYRLIADARALSKLTKKLKNSVGTSRCTGAQATAVADIAECVDKAVRQVGQRCAQSFLGILARFAAEEARSRRATGELTYDDLLAISLELVETRPDIRQRLPSRYSYFLVDEFQDTDSLQVLLIFSLMGLCSGVMTGGSRTSDECVLSHQHMPDPPDGRLVVVGDIKQSIYAFRGAEPAVLKRISDRWSSYVRQLQANFRCHPEIVGFVNEVFATAFSGKMNPQQYTGSEGQPDKSDNDGQHGGLSPAGVENLVKFVPLLAARTVAKEVEQSTDTLLEPVTAPRVIVIGGPRFGSAEHVRDEEMSHVASLILEATGADGQGGWRVERIASDGRGFVDHPRFSDIAVLIRGRTWLAALERSFEEYEIPYRLETGELLYSTQEAHDISTILACIEDPFDAVSVVAALKSSIFACSDQDLLEYYVACGNTDRCWQYTSGLEPSRTSTGSDNDGHASRKPTGKAYVAACMDMIRSLHEESRYTPLPRLLERILRAQRILEGALLDKAYRERWRRYRLLIDDARRFFEEGGRSIREYLRWMEIMREEGSEVGKNVFAGPDENAVRVLTIHGAKGLEFPIVFAIGTAIKTSGVPPQHVLVGGDNFVELRLGAKDLGIETEGFSSLQIAKQDQTAQEEVRLAYVAFTRARDYLVVSRYAKGYKKNKKPSSFSVDRAIAELLPRIEESEVAKGDPVYEERSWGRLRWEPTFTPTKADRADRDRVSLAVASSMKYENRPRHSSSEEPPLDVVDGDSTSHDRRRATPLALQILPRVQGGLALRPPIFSATEVAQLLAPYDFGSSSRTRSGTRGHVDPLAVGRAVHEALARLDLTADLAAPERAILSAVSETLFTLGSQAPPQSLVIDLVTKALQLRTPKEAAFCRHFKEVYVCSPIDEAVAIEGYADLVLERDDGLVVADYKTDSLQSARDRETLVLHYSYQVSAYALALWRATGRPVVRCSLLFLGDNDPSEIDIDNVNERMKEIGGKAIELLDERNRILKELQSAAPLSRG
ncbi:MAG: hypothetical protein C4318_08145 [Acidimicrobiia bacterium]